MAGATGYNLNHLQVAAKETTPTFTDINYAMTAEFGITQDSDTLKADGGSRVTAYGSREGEGSISFGSADLTTIAVLTGDEFSTSGVTPSIVDRLEMLGSTSPPNLILAGWIPNVDGNSDRAGMRVTVTNGTVSVPSTSFDQETWTEFESDLSFVSDENDVMLIWEVMETAPAFASGVIPVALATPST